MVAVIIIIVMLLLALLCFVCVSASKLDGEQEVSDQEQIRFIEEYNRKKKSP